MKRTILLISFMLTLGTFFSFSQGVGINTDESDADPSAILDVKSTTQGMLVPRMTVEQAFAISTPAEGLLVFGTDVQSFLYYKSGTWNYLTSEFAKMIADFDFDTRITTGNELDPDDDMIKIYLGDSENESFRIIENRIESATPNLLMGYQAGKDITTGTSNTVFGNESFILNSTGIDNTALGYTALNANSSGLGNTAAGSGALYSNSTGNNNTAAGYFALNSNLGGYQNTGVGYKSLLSNATGSRNTAVGANALFHNLGAHYSVAVGFNAAFYSESGSYNTAIGSWALENNLTGESNVAIGVKAASQGQEFSNAVAIGDYALFNNGVGATDWSHGSSNTAVGSKALYDNTIGYANTATGSNSLISNTEGYANTANGAWALQSNTEGDFNTAYGHSSLIANQTGNNNTAVGFQALGGNSTGSGNTAIGYKAGLNITEGAENIIIGSNVNATDPTGSNQLNIGNALYGDLNEVKIGIRNPSPQAALDVNGIIKVGSEVITPKAGMVRWNAEEQDFEGYTGTQWVSFTTVHGGWGGNNTATETSTAILSDGWEYDYFGKSVCVSGDYAIIGAYEKIDGEFSNGKAYIFLRSGTAWIKQAELFPSDGDAYDSFGISVSISGNYAIVGASSKDIGANTDQGKAYIYYRSGTSWTQQAALTAPDGAAYDFFGGSVAISGDYAIVGAGNKTINSNNSQGKAYIFYRSGTSWTFQAGLTASDASWYENFGSSVSISGVYTIIGAPGKMVEGNANQGKAYMFHRSGTVWTEEETFVDYYGSPNDNFGNSVSISGNYAIVGAKNNSSGGKIGQGKAYIFHGSPWFLETELLAPDGEVYDAFSYHVSISGDYAIVGAPNKNIGGIPDQGKAYVFHRSYNTWSHQASLSSSDGAAGDSFGHSVSIYGDHVIVGAPMKNIGGLTNHGKVYFFNHQ